MAKRIPTGRGWVAMTTRNVWLTVILLVVACVSLEIAVNGVDNTWLDVKTIFFKTLFSPLTLLGVVFVSMICAAAEVWMAAYKLRTPFEGFMLGFFLGPVGIVIEAALPELGEYAGSGLPANGKR
jgi:hypothetical protein